MSGEGDIKILLGEIKGIQQEMLKKLEKQEDSYDDMSKRVTEIETKLNYAAGLVAAFCLVFTLSWDWIKTRLGI